MNDFTQVWRGVGAFDAGLTLEDWGGVRLYRYTAVVREPFDRYVHDGDTFDVTLDLGLKIKIDGFTVRPYGYDAPELNTQAGKYAREFLLGTFETMKRESGKAMLALQTIQDGRGDERMTFDRYLCHVALVDKDGTLADLATYMIDHGHGVERTK